MYIHVQSNKDRSLHGLAEEILLKQTGTNTQLCLVPDFVESV